jgi:hypothetical protein
VIVRGNTKAGGLTVRIADTAQPVGETTGAIDPANLGARCVGDRLVAMARAAAAIHQGMAAARRAVLDTRPGAVGEGSR